MAIISQPVRTLPQDYPAFADLPVRYVTARDPARRLAVHVHGRLATDRTPVIFVPGFCRNMSDFAAAVPLLSAAMGEDWPIVLLDLAGRGRSADRAQRDDYASPADAQDVAAVADALGAERAFFVGDGYGGQVVMALAAARPLLVAGAVLIDAGPLSDAPGLVRLRTNLEMIGSLRGEAAFRRTTRQVLSVDYPSAPPDLLDAIAARTHYVDGSGRVHALFDPRLVELLAGIELDDVLVPQWPYFDALGSAPLVLMRTELTGQVTAETFDAMLRRRRDAEGFVIEGQGSPALLDSAEHVAPIAGLVAHVALPGQRRAR